MSDQPVKAWICPICGYVHYGDTPPDECPVCGAEGSTFEPYLEKATVQNPMPGNSVATVVIAGAGIAGVSAAEAVRKISPATRIILLSDETELPYYRINLTRYLAGELKTPDLMLHTQQWYADNAIEIHPGKRIKDLNLDQKSISLESGESYPYDRLILTTGASPFYPPIEGIHLKNVTALRKQADADFILSAARSGKQIVCIGGGILGLETAGAIARWGTPVTVLEALPWLMPRQLNQKAARIFENKLGSFNISVKTNVKIKTLTGNAAVEGVLLEDGTMLAADVVVISAGVRSNVDLARRAGLTVNQGIVVDDQMQTSNPDVYAAGDNVEHRGVLYGTWTPAQLQGSIAGMSAVNQQSAFPGVPRSTTLKVLGIELYSIGLTAPESGTDRLVDETIGQNYYSFVFRDHSLAGAILLGDASLSTPVKKAIEDQKDFSALFKNGPSVQSLLDVLTA